MMTLTSLGAMLAVVAGMTCTTGGPGTITFGLFLQLQ